MGIHDKLKKTLEYRAVSELHAYENNARTHSEEQVSQIAASIREFGFTNPVLVDGKGEIIAGHGRVMAAMELGMAEVPVIVLDHLSDAQKRAYVLADNKLALNAGWDMNLLASELSELADEDYDLSVVGFTEKELSELLPDAEQLAEMPALPSGDKSEFQQMTFTLHNEQAEQVKQAMEIAKGMGKFDSPNENGNGNALARVAECFLTKFGATDGDS